MFAYSLHYIVDIDFYKQKKYLSLIHVIMSETFHTLAELLMTVSKSILQKVEVDEIDTELLNLLDLLHSTNQIMIEKAERKQTCVFIEEPPHWVFKS